MRKYQPKEHWHIGEFNANDTFFCLQKHIKTAPNTFFHLFLPKITHYVKSNYKPFWNVVKQYRLQKHEEYLKQIPFEAIQQHEQQLLQHATARLLDQAGTRIIGQAAHKSGVISFTCDEVHPHDLGTLLDYEGIAIRAGHHCTMPVMDRFGVPATVRASFSVYNTLEEVDIFCDALARVRIPFRD